MASRTVILLLILSAIGADAAAAGPLPPPPRHLLRSDPVRALADGDGSGGVGSADIPTLAESRRRLQEVVISSQCLNTLAASADEKGNLGPENFYVFTDGMSNGYFSTNNMRDYAALPLQNKFAFVTLSCQCHAFGGKSNCCQGLRARIRVDGVDPSNPESMNEQLQQYVSDICSTTVDAIGEENILPPLAEAITVTTSSPSVTPLPAIEAAPGVGEIDADVSGGGLSGGAVAGIVIAGAVFVTLLIFLMAPKRQSDEALDGDEDLSHVDQNDTEKELMAITNGEVDPDAPARQESPDSSTADMTFCDSGSLSTKESSSKTVEASNFYAKNSLLPVNPDEESLSTNDQQSFFSSEESVELQGATASSDASAIENGDWQQVAANAKACVNKNEPMQSTEKMSSFQSVRSGWEV